MLFFSISLGQLRASIPCLMSGMPDKIEGSCPLRPHMDIPGPIQVDIISPFEKFLLKGRTGFLNIRQEPDFDGGKV